MSCTSFCLIDDESGSEEETLQYYSTVDPNYRSRRRKKLDSQNKNSQSFLSVLLNVTHGLVSIFTDVKVRHWGWNEYFVVLTMGGPFMLYVLMLKEMVFLTVIQ